MKKSILMLLVLVTVTLYGVGESAVIWDFETPSGMPTSIVRFGYFYVYMSSTVAGQGIGGSNALQISVPSVSRTWGGGFDLNASPALNLTGTPFMYGYISADSASTFGVAFEVESGGYLFIPPPGPYTSYAQISAGTIGTSFIKVEFDLQTFNKYGTTGAPNLSTIEQMTWIFPDNTGVTSGPVNFYIDNIGARAPADIKDWSIFATPVMEIKDSKEVMVDLKNQ